MAGFDPTVGISAAEQMRNAYLHKTGESSTNIFGNPTSWADSWTDFATQYSLAQQTFENNKEMWNLMNEYNSPQSQMQRFKEAGLNPMLIYQQGSAGNASSPVQYSQPNVRMSPNSDRNAQINQALQVVQTMNQVVQNVASMFDTSYDLALKRNQLAFSDYETASAYNHLSGFGYGNRANTFQVGDFGEFDYSFLNPYSPNFDPSAFTAYEKIGKLPSYFRGIWLDTPRRDYSQYRANFQKFYNERLLPKFEQYQQGKIDLQEIEKEVEEYRKQTLTMIPAELRGIIEPIAEYLGPFLKFIFKRSSGSFTSNNTHTEHYHQFATDPNDQEQNHDK